MGQYRPLFHLFLDFSNKHYKFSNQLMWKMSIQYPSPGFKFTTFWLWVSSFNHWTRVPGQSLIHLLFNLTSICVLYNWLFTVFHLLLSVAFHFRSLASILFTSDPFVPAYFSLSFQRKKCMGNDGGFRDFENNRCQFFFFISGEDNKQVPPKEISLSHSLLPSFQIYHPLGKYNRDFKRVKSN